MSEKQLEENQIDTVAREDDFTKELTSANDKNEVTNTYPEQSFEKELKHAVTEIISEYSGPIPPPSILSGYEKILPGSAERILAMAEKQSNHRQNMEEKMIKSESRDSLLGILFAFFLGCGCMIVAVIIVLNVQTNVGAVFGSLFGASGIASIVASFLKGTRGNGNDKE